MKVKVRINNHGLFTVQSASMVEKVETAEEEQGPESMETDAGKENAGAPNGEGQKAEAPMETEASAESQPAGDAEMKEANGDKKVQAYC